MKNLAKVLGQRVRNYRTQQGLSQEKLAELAGCHATYIGQIERGEKNATLESVDKICTGLGISLSQLFEKLDGDAPGTGIAFQAYELISSKPHAQQMQLYNMLLEMDKYKQQ